MIGTNVSRCGANEVSLYLLKYFYEPVYAQFPYTVYGEKLIGEYSGNMDHAASSDNLRIPGWYRYRNSFWFTFPFALCDLISSNLTSTGLGNMTFTRHVTNAITRAGGESIGMKASGNYMLITRKLEFRLAECYFWRSTRCFAGQLAWANSTPGKIQC